MYGFLALIFGLSSFLPIVYNIIKTKNTSNFIWSALLLALLASVFILLEGNQTGSLFLMINGIIYTLLYIIIIFIKLT